MMVNHVMKTMVENRPWSFELSPFQNMNNNSIIAVEIKIQYLLQVPLNASELINKNNVALIIHSATQYGSISKMNFSHSVKLIGSVVQDFSDIKYVHAITNVKTKGIKFLKIRYLSLVTKKFFLSASKNL